MSVFDYVFKSMYVCMLLLFLLKTFLPHIYLSHYLYLHLFFFLCVHFHFYLYLHLHLNFCFRRCGCPNNTTSHRYIDRYGVFQYSSVRVRFGGHTSCARRREPINQLTHTPVPCLHHHHHHHHHHHEVHAEERQDKIRRVQGREVWWFSFVEIEEEVFSRSLVCERSPCFICLCFSHCPKLFIFFSLNSLISTLTLFYSCCVGVVLFVCFVLLYCYFQPNSPSATSFPWVRSPREP